VYVSHKKTPLIVSNISDKEASNRSHKAAGTRKEHDPDAFSKMDEKGGSSWSSKSSK
jgi:hypothetical protein